MIDFEPFAVAALYSHLTPFVELKGRIENAIGERARQGKK